VDGDMSEIVQNDMGSKFNQQFGNSLYSKEVRPTHLGNSLKNSYNQLLRIKKLENLKTANKLWYKLKEEEMALLNKMSINCYLEKPSYNSV
jgi:hypothetical protein